MGGAFSWGGATLRARRGAAAEFGCSLRNVSCQAQMNILLWPPPLLLLLAALVAQATAATTYRPDWNRLRGLARGRVEVSAPFPILSRIIASEPLSPQPWNTAHSGLGNIRIPEAPSFPPAWHRESSLLFPATGCAACTVGAIDVDLAAWHSEPLLCSRLGRTVDL